MTDATLPLDAAPRLTAQERRHARREVRRHRVAAFVLVAPLLLFLLFAFVAPIATMLGRSVYNPAVAELIPATLEALEGWDGQGVPAEPAVAVFAQDLARLARERSSGRLAEEMNRVLPGASSTVQMTARRLGRLDTAALAAEGPAAMREANAAWAEPGIWRALAEAGRVWTGRNFLTALDLERGEDGTIRPRESARIYLQLYAKTLRMALVITALTLILGYPLAFWLAHQPSRRANMLMIFVLLPFWTSLLVRTTAWIALLQTNGVVNSTLTGLGLIGEPLTLLYTEFATILAMTHILLPFMVLPLHSVMKGIDPSYMRAAMSMGARPFRAFRTVYLPATLPGLSAGAMLVFIISVGYYITPALVGGTDGQMISNIIAFHMQQSNNWGLAAALGSLLLALILFIYFVFDRLVGASNIKLG